jgi:hypothetical protein
MVASDQVTTQARQFRHLPKSFLPELAALRKKPQALLVPSCSSRDVISL